MRQRATTIDDYTLQQELGEATNVRPLNANASLVFSPRLLALASDVQTDFVRFDEHLNTSSLRECMALAIARMETFALAAICGSELSFAHFVAPESQWPGGEMAVKANARRYWDIVQKYHDSEYVQSRPFDRHLLASMHDDLLAARLEQGDRLDPEQEAAASSFRTVDIQGTIPFTQVGEYVDNLMAFSSQPLYPTQVQSCVTHLQTHYISPFTTLNGPLGNLLSYALYSKRSFSKNVFVTIGITTLEKIDHPLDSYTVREDSPSDPYGLWVYHAVKAVSRQVDFMKRVEARFQEIADRWMASLGQKRCSSVCLKLAHDLLSVPLVDSATIQQRYGRTAPAANSIITTMVDHGILTPVNANKRYRLFCAKDVIEIYYDSFSNILPKGWIPANFTKLDLL